jgi:group I intron endonuclease
MKKSISGIYKITNLINGKAYIGEAKDIYSRWYEHRHVARCLLNGIKRSPCSIHYAMAKYGVDNFKFETVLEIDKNKLTDTMLSTFEIFFIADYNTFEKGYNETKGGEGTKGYKLSKESKEKISKAHKGKIVSEQVRKQIGQALRGKSPSNTAKINHKKAMRSPIVRKKIGEANRRRLISNEQKDKISKSMKGRFVGKLSPRWGIKFNESFYRKRSSPVICVETQEYFVSCGQAGKYTGLEGSNIDKSARRGQKTSGLHWKFITWDDYDKLKQELPLFYHPI